MSYGESATHPGSRWAGVGLVALLAADVAILARAWWMSGRGLDLTDEGMYLTWMTSPWDWPWASTQFAFFFHPLWELLGQDLVLTRRITVALLLLAGAGFFAAVLRRAFGLGRARSLLTGALLAPSVLLAVGSQSVFFTPSYNMLGMFGLLAAGAALAGMLLPGPRDAGRHQLRHWPWVLLGLGGVLCFASRPTAGALLLVIVILALLVAGTWSWRGIGIAAGTAVAAFLAMALAIDGNPVTFVERVLEGLHLYGLQTQRSALDALVNTFTYDLNWQQADVVWGAGLAVLLAAAVLLRRAGRLAPAALVAVCVAAAGAAVWAGVAGATPLTGRVGRSATVAFFLWAGVTVASLVAARGMGRRAVAAVGALWLLPFAYAFATHYSTVALAGSAAFCWLASSLVGVGAVAKGERSLPAVGAVWLLVTVLCLNAAAGAAPRQEPLGAQDVPYPLAGRGDVLLSADMARYLDSVAASMADAGFRPGMPVLDLTGESPGLVYHLQARATADSWVIGRYPGSRDRLARELALHTPCERTGESWLLVSPDGARAIDPEVLGDLGIAFPTDYGLVATEAAPKRSGAFTLEVWAPREPADLVAGCLSARR